MVSVESQRISYDSTVDSEVIERETLPTSGNEHFWSLGHNMFGYGILVNRIHTYSHSSTFLGRANQSNCILSASVWPRGWVQLQSTLIGSVLPVEGNLEITYQTANPDFGLPTVSAFYYIHLCELLFSLLAPKFFSVQQTILITIQASSVKNCPSWSKEWIG